MPERVDVAFGLNAGRHMRRREFLSLLGWAAAWPVASKAQATERTRVIGVLEILGSDDPETKTRSEVFAQTLQQLGWAVGRDLKIETRNVGGDLDHLRRYAAELIALTPDVIVSVGSVTVAPLQQATRTIPIVFVNVPDPVGVVQPLAYCATFAEDARIGD
jgi:putative ABC transport system substrate-binding protein